MTAKQEVWVRTWEESLLTNVIFSNLSNYKRIMKRTRLHHIPGNSQYITCYVTDIASPFVESVPTTEFNYFVSGHS